MHGNVFEWCADRYSDSYYVASPAEDPKGPESGEYRVFRGGSWYLRPISARSASRFRVAPDVRLSSFGFRLARTL